MKKRLLNTPKNETHTIKTYIGTESYFKEELGIIPTDNKKDSVNYSTSNFIDELIISDVADIYDHRIYLNNQKIADVEHRINSIDSEISNLKEQLDYWYKAKTESVDYLSKLKKDNDEYISNKKKYEVKSMNTLINKVLLIYVEDSTAFKDSTIQNILDSYSNLYHQNIMLEYIYKFLDNYTGKLITLIDKESDEETEINFELDFSSVKDIKKVLNTLFIDK